MEERTSHNILPGWSVSLPFLFIKMDGFEKREGNLRVHAYAWRRKRERERERERERSASSTVHSPDNRPLLKTLLTRPRYDLWKTRPTLDFQKWFKSQNYAFWTDGRDGGNLRERFLFYQSTNRVTREIEPEFFLIFHSPKLKFL